MCKEWGEGQKAYGKNSGGCGEKEKILTDTSISVKNIIFTVSVKCHWLVTARTRQVTVTMEGKGEKKVGSKYESRNTQWEVYLLKFVSVS